MRWPWVLRKTYEDKNLEYNEEIANLKNDNNYLIQTNKTLSSEMNEANKYARALEESFNGKASVVVDYNMSMKDLQERMQVTRIVRPDCMSRELGFQIRIPEEWERIFNGFDDLTKWIEYQVRGLLECQVLRNVNYGKRNINIYFY